MKTIARWSCLAAPVLVACLAVLFVGCEGSDDTYSLTVSPEEAELVANGETQIFEVLQDTEETGELSSPIEWSVSDSSKGVIVSSSGYKAIYQRLASGVNIVYAKDQYGSKGYATVNPRAAQDSDSDTGNTLTVAANPSPIPAGQNSSTVTVTRGTSPYTWNVGDSSYGILDGSATAVTIYTSKRVGINTIYVVDANGARGQINIEQE